MFRLTAKDLRLIMSVADNTHVPKQTEDAIDFTLNRMEARAGDTLLPRGQRESVIVHWVLAGEIRKFIPEELAAKKPIRLGQLADQAVRHRYTTELRQAGFLVTVEEFTHPDGLLFDYLVVSCAEVQE